LIELMWPPDDPQGAFEHRIPKNSSRDFVLALAFASNGPARLQATGTPTPTFDLVEIPVHEHCAWSLHKRRGTRASRFPEKEKSPLSENLSGRQRA
jgi:hypothetical protein